jgi:hypothetical protein
MAKVLNSIGKSWQNRRNFLFDMSRQYPLVESYLMAAPLSSQGVTFSNTSEELNFE